MSDSILRVAALKQEIPNGIETTMSVSWKYGCSEDEIKGRAVAFALKTKPGFSIMDVAVVGIPGLIPDPNYKKEPEQPAE